MHICIISPTDIIGKTKWGGVHTHTEMLSNLLVKEGYKVTLIIPADHTDKIYKKVINNIRIVFLYGIEKRIVDKKWIKNVHETFNKIYKQEPVDVIFSEGYSAYGLQKKYINLPIVSFVHNFSFIHFYNNWTEVESIRSLLSYLLKTIPKLLFRMFRYEIPFYHKSKYTVSCSKLNAKYLHKIYQIPEYKLKVVQNWVDTNYFCPNGFSRKKYRQRLNIPNNNLVFLLVGSLWRPKGFHVVIKAFKEFILQVPNAMLLIAGSGRQERNLQNLVIKSETIKEKVKFVGFWEHSKLPYLYNSVDIFLMPSLLSEVLPYTLLEAMSVGLPVVATRIGGNKELVVDAGILVPPGDVNALEQAMIELAQNPEKRKELSQRARERVKDYFSEELAIKKISLLLAENLPDKIH